MSTTAIPHQSYGALFLRFLRFGALAWGGPVAQIAMIKRELVEEERWISPERFNRTLAVYQALPGPEAHELCVYFGMLARGRIGGVLAGLGFMLPGFMLMMLMSWAYVASRGALATDWHPVFIALQAAVLALIVRAVHRIGTHAVNDRWLFVLAAMSLAGSLAGVHFAVNLGLAGAFYVLIRKAHRSGAALSATAWIAAIAFVTIAPAGSTGTAMASAPATAGASLPSLLYSGLKAGLLTFGGAYTAIPFLQEDAVARGAWMTNDQFLDGIALGGTLPAPLIIFGTFVGFLGGGWLGALALTLGIFLPAFGFTLVAHDALERITKSEKSKHFLAGMTAGVVGLIAATTVNLAPAALGSLGAGVVFAGALVLLYVVRHKLSVLLVMGSAAVAGRLFF
jgi:chromate transporter